jgi:uncharacterized Fe-S cluster protein YjdI
MPEEQASKAKEYRGPDIVVSFDARLCIHSGNCVRGLPEVFDPEARPWVRADRASGDRIAEVVERCPTGALHFRHADGRSEAAPERATIRVAPNGPLYLRGQIEVQAPDGEVIRRDTRMALCRCGHSANKPFCDGSHRRVSFQAP